MKLNLIKKNQTTRTQEGVTLLISVLIMSGLALISLSVAAFAIQELRASRAVVATEPAISAAESGGEQALWAISRGTAINPCPTVSNPNPPQTNLALGNGSFVNTCKSYSDATIQLRANTPFVFYLYDPANVNGDVDLQSYPYSNLTVIHQSGTSNVDIRVVRIDGSAVGAQPVSLSPGATQVINIPAVTAGTEGRMKVTLLSTGDATLNLNTNQGMPTFPTINAGGCASRTSVTDCNPANQELFNRRINITVGGGLAGPGGGAPPSTVVTASPASVLAGGTITVTITGGPANPADWIAFYPQGALDANYLTWQYLNGSTTAPATGSSSATLTFTAPSTPGNYEFRFFLNNTFTLIAKSNIVTYSIPVMASPSNVNDRGTITVSVSGGPGNPTDWVAFYPKGAADPAWVAWQWLNGTGTAPGVSAASLTFTAPDTPGQYEFRFFSNNSYTLLGKSNTVTQIFSMAASPNPVSPSGTITVTVAGGPGNANDWVAFYPQGAAEGAYITWQWLSGSANPPGVSSATLTFTAPATPGNYEFRFHPNNSLTTILTTPVIVQ